MDAGVDAQADVPNGQVDGGPSGCIKVSIEDAFQGYLDDVSAEYRTRITPTLPGNGNELSTLFERYNDAVYEGSFELGQGADANFGTCAHCAVVLTADPERAFFATAGTMVLNKDPFSRELDIALMGLRLAEVTVNPETRESTLVPGGACVEVADFAKQGVFPPSEWTCPLVDGFAQGYCGPNNICRSVCDEQADCTVAGETCRFFSIDETLGYCGPEPTDG